MQELQFDYYRRHFARVFHSNVYHADRKGGYERMSGSLWAVLLSGREDFGYSGRVRQVYPGSPFMPDFTRFREYMTERGSNGSITV